MVVKLLSYRRTPGRGVAQWRRPSVCVPVCLSPETRIGLAWQARRHQRCYRWFLPREKLHSSREIMLAAGAYSWHQ